MPPPLAAVISSSEDARGESRGDALATPPMLVAVLLLVFAPWVFSGMSVLTPIAALFSAPVLQHGIVPQLLLAWRC